MQSQSNCFINKFNQRILVTGNTNKLLQSGKRQYHWFVILNIRLSDCCFDVIFNIWLQGHFTSIILINCQLSAPDRACRAAVGEESCGLWRHSGTSLLPHLPLLVLSHQHTEWHSLRHQDHRHQRSRLFALLQDSQFLCLDWVKVRWEDRQDRTVSHEKTRQVSREHLIICEWSCFTGL